MFISNYNALNIIKIIYIIWVVYKLFFLQEFENKALYSGKARKKSININTDKKLNKKNKNQGQKYASFFIYAFHSNLI